MFQTIINDGADYPLKKEALNENDLQKELDIMTNRGNHKSACTPTNKKILLEAYDKEVQHGWQIPITVESH